MTSKVTRFRTRSRRIDPRCTVTIINNTSLIWGSINRRYQNIAPRRGPQILRLFKRRSRNIYLNCLKYYRWLFRSKQHALMVCYTVREFRRLNNRCNEFRYYYFKRLSHKYVLLTKWYHNLVH